MKTRLLSVALLMGVVSSAAAQNAADDFNRADSPSLGPDWVVDDGGFSIHENRVMLNNPWSLGFVHHAIPIAAGTMTLGFSGAGDIAVVEITSVGGGTENFQGTGILSFTYPPSGSNFGFGGMGDSHVDNWSGQIGPIVPTYTISSLIAGQSATLEVNNLTTGDSVLFGYSLTGAGPTNTVYGLVDMSLPIRCLPSVSANGSGVASFTLTVPANAAGLTVYSQALVVNTSTLTNSLALTVQ